MNTIKVLTPSPLTVDDSLLIEGDVREVLPRLPDESVQCVITSPPYWGLRDYGIHGQIGLERTLAGFINTLTGVFAEVRRVLKRDGVLWLNIGDGFTSGNRGWRAPDKKNPNRGMAMRPDNPPELKDKDLLGVPWRLAFALQADGWYLRSDVIWHKPNAMPESVKDRPTRAHEYLFMFSKQESYDYYPDAVLEKCNDGGTRNRRSVWSINTSPSNSHVAAFPRELIYPCIQSSTKPGEMVLDPFFGSGTVGLACRDTQRKCIGIELNPKYIRSATELLENSTQKNGNGTNPYRLPANGNQPALLETPSKRRHISRSVS